MNEWVIDASVVVKWIFPDQPDEIQAKKALNLLEGIRASAVEVIQPPHWLAETAAVATRLDAAIAAEVIPLLYAMELPIAGDLEIYRRAMSIAAELEHHLFDTLYHAVALERPATLVTADERYYRKARRLGRIVRLSEVAAS